VHALDEEVMFAPEEHGSSALAHVLISYVWFCRSGH